MHTTQAQQASQNPCSGREDLSIGEVAKRLGVATSTIRYYEQEDLLQNLKRTEGGSRRFDHESLETLHVIDCLKRTGLSIAEIRSFMQMVAKGDSTIDERLQLFLHRRESVEAQIAELQDMLDFVNYKIRYYSEAKRRGTCEGVAHQNHSHTQKSL